MVVSDPVADMLTKVRNASQAKHEKVDISNSKLKLQIVKIMKNEGFIKNFKKVTKDGATYLRVFRSSTVSRESPLLAAVSIPDTGRCPVFSTDMALSSFRLLPESSPVRRHLSSWSAES